MTSRAQILAAARRLIDQDGWEKLTIRGLAAEIGIGPTTLYHHVRDKEDLLFLLIREYADSIPYPELPADPRDRVVAAATAIHDALAAWPWAAEVLTTDGFIARVGDSALRLVEAVLAGAVDFGCTREQAVHVFRSIWYYTVGEILVRVRAHHAHQAAGDEQPTAGSAFSEALDAPRLPHLAALSSRWPALAWQDTYPHTLGIFVDALLAAYASRSPAH